jgi:hypothetical protein
VPRSAKCETGHRAGVERRGVGVYAATGPHDHHLRDRCVDPQIQIRKQLLRLATTSPPTPDALDGGFAPELFPLDPALGRPPPWALGRHHGATLRPLMRRRARPRWPGHLRFAARIHSAGIAPGKASAHLRHEPPM